MEQQYDLAVIGAGPGGYVAAIAASRLGLSTALIEKDKAGGVCLNMGCIPSKALIHQAEIYTQALAARSLGLGIDTAGFDYGKVFKKSRAAATRLSKGVEYLIGKNKISYIQGFGSIEAPEQISVEAADGSRQNINARKILIATGSRPRELPGFEFDGQKVLSSDHALLLEKLPESMIILGAGAIGCEFAHIMNSFGSKITLVEMMDSILPLEDKDSSAVLASAFKKRKIEILTSTKAQSLQKDSSGVELIVEQDGKQKSLKAEKLLVVTGRVPNTEGFGLQELGVELEKGFIKTGAFYESSVPGIHAIGDVIATPLLAHAASAEGELVVRHLAGKQTRERLDSRMIPQAVYSEPQVASFGFSAVDAEAKGFKVKTSVFPYRGCGKAVAIENADGQVKLISDADTGQILGASIAGAQATELIHEYLLAAGSELLTEDITETIHAHPTLSEGLMEAAREAMEGAIHI